MPESSAKASLSGFAGDKPLTYAKSKRLAPKIEKITRASFLYMDPRAPKDEFAQCETCVHFLADLGKCELVSAKSVDDDDSCGLYAPGKAPADTKPLNLVTPAEAGFVSREVRCENCRFFDPDTEPREHCDLYTQLNLILPLLFSLDRYVKAKGCCNAQTEGKRNPEVFGPFGPITHGGSTE